MTSSAINAGSLPMPNPHIKDSFTASPLLTIRLPLTLTTFFDLPLLKVQTFLG